MESDLEKIRSVADYQFGKGIGLELFPEGVEIHYSRNTGRIRYVYLNGERLVTMRPTDGLFSLSMVGANRIAENPRSTKCFVTVRDDVARFVAGGSDVFAVHVVKADDVIRAGNEIIVVDNRGNVLAVGRALLSGEEMKAFRRGVAVKVRRGSREKS